MQRVKSSGLPFSLISFNEWTEKDSYWEKKTTRGRKKPRREQLSIFFAHAESM
jgi:hypothetical protein